MLAKLYRWFIMDHMIDMIVDYALSEKSSEMDEDDGWDDEAMPQLTRLPPIDELASTSITDVSFGFRVGRVGRRRDKLGLQPQSILGSNLYPSSVCVV